MPTYLNTAYSIAHNNSLRFGTWVYDLFNATASNLGKMLLAFAKDVLIYGAKIYAALSEFLVSMPARLQALKITLTPYINSLRYGLQSLLQKAINSQAFIKFKLFLVNMNVTILNLLRPLLNILNALVARIPFLSGILARVGILLQTLNPTLLLILQSLLLINILPYVLALAAASAIFVYTLPIALVTGFLGNITNLLRNTWHNFAKHVSHISSLVNMVMHHNEIGFLGKARLIIGITVLMIVKPIQIVCTNLAYFIANTIALPFSAFKFAMHNALDTTRGILNLPIIRNILRPWQLITGGSRHMPVLRPVRPDVHQAFALTNATIDRLANQTRHQATDLADLKAKSAALEQGFAAYSAQIASIDPALASIQSRIDALQAEFARLSVTPEPGGQSATITSAFDARTQAEHFGSVERLASSLNHAEAGSANDGATPGHVAPGLNPGG